MKILFLLLLLPSLAFATWGSDDCDHPRFQEVGCTYPGEKGDPGEDGQDGADGAKGDTGERGLQGTPGVVSTTWITETRNWQSKWLHYAAASDAIQVHLPQDLQSRLTFGMSSIRGTQGYAVGYAFKNDDNIAVTFALGTSGGEQVGKASIGFEFGGKSKPKYISFSECTYVNGKLNFEQKCVKAK